METKFCKHCGESINKEAVICIKCGLQVEELKSQNPQIVVNNTNTNNNNNSTSRYKTRRLRRKNKWISLALCALLGIVGAHKFYEERVGLGVLYLFTGGLLGIGMIVDLISLLCKPTYYYCYI